MKIPATITHVSGKGVQVTGHRLEKPDIKDFKTPFGYSYKLQEYESSKFTAWVENLYPEEPIEKGCVWITGWYEKPLQQEYLTRVKLGQSCQIIETREGKCKIISLK